MQSFGHQGILKHIFTVDTLCSTQITNHFPNNNSEPDERLYRLMSKLQGWDHEILNVPGIMNTTADLLSRPPTAAIKTSDVKIEINWAVKMFCF